MKRGAALLCAGLGVASVLAGQILFTLHDPYPPPPRFSADPLLWASLPLFAGGGLLTLVGLLLLPLPALRPGEAPADAGRTSRRHKCAVALVVGLAFALRAYDITEMPPPLFDDEANLALDAMKYLDGQFPPGTYTGWFETPLAFSAVNSLALRYFGPTVLGSRVTGLVFGTLTVLSLYFVARSMMSPSTALLVMLGLAVQRWHVTMSRWGANHITLPFLVTIAYLFAARAFDLVLGAESALGVNSRRPRLRTDGPALRPVAAVVNAERADHSSRWYRQPEWSAIAGGLFLGAAMYTYLVSRLAAVAMALFLGYLVFHALAVARRYRRSVVARRIVAAVLYGMVYLLVVSPLALHYYRHPGMFTNRYKSISLPQEMGIGSGTINWQPLLTNLTSYSLMLNYASNEVSRFGPPLRPVLNPICGVLFALGMVFLFRHWWRPANLFCLLWLAMPLAGGVITWSETPSPLRTVVASTAVPLIMLVPFHYAVLWASQQPWWERRRRLLFGGAAGVLLVSGAMDQYTYWVTQRSEPTLYRHCNYPEYNVARRVRDLGEEHPVYLRPHLYTFSSVRLLNWKRRNFNLFVPSEHIPLLQPEDADAYIFVEPSQRGVFGALQLFQPRARWSDVPLPESPGFEHSEILIPATQLAESRGLWVTTAGGHKRLTRVLEAPSDSAADLRQVTWEAVLDAPELNGYRFAVRSTEPLGNRCRLTVAHLPVADADQLVNLLGGRTPVRLSVHDMRPGERIDLLWRYGQTDWEPVPINRLYALPSAGSYGLRGSYFLGSTPSGTPLAVRTDLFLAANERMPSPHSVRWTGALAIAEEGTYGFKVRADDGTRVSIDGNVVIDRWEAGDTVTGWARVALTRGSHPIQVDYFDQGGGRTFEFTWTTPGGQHGFVPFDVLSHVEPRMEEVPFQAGRELAFSGD